MKSIKQVLLLGLTARLALIAWGYWQDQRKDLINYTDVDYWVFKDASDNIFNSKSPFDRSTYRYTPLLALLLFPFYKIGSISSMTSTTMENILDKVWGKLIFSCFDLLAGYLIYSLVQLNENKIPSTRRASFLAGIFWILNPFVMTISTRGNSEAILVSLILATLLLTLKGKIFLAGLVWGFSIHWKIVPLILGPGIISYFWFNNKGKSSFSNAASIVSPSTPQSQRLYSPKSPSSWLSSRQSSHSSTPLGTPTKNIRSLQLSPIPLRGGVGVGAGSGSGSGSGASNCTYNLASSNSDEIDTTISSPSFAYFSPSKDSSSSCLLENQATPEMNKILQVSKAMTKAFGRAHTQKKADRSLLFQRMQRMLIFLISSFIGLIVPSIMSYRWFGASKYIKEAWLYHFSRVDHRHNFSPYWFMIYSELGNDDNSSFMTSSIQFIPQILLILRLGFKCGHLSLETTSFLQLFLFVSLNRVITSQYFLWYLALLPLVFDGLKRGSLNNSLFGSMLSAKLPFMLKSFSSKHISLVGPLLLLFGWIGSQALWLRNAYMLEFEGDLASMRRIFYCGLGMLSFNILIASSILKAKFIDVSSCFVKRTSGVGGVGGLGGLGGGKVSSSSAFSTPISKVK